jgi:S-disulfanyl-L-cysteine oxidoreductase SoxD
MFSFPESMTVRRASPGLSARLAGVKALGALAVWMAAASLPAWGQTPDRFPGVGRAATPREVAAWDIDVRPDFKGLPKGSGTVAKGQDVWEAKCASCHGVFGESNEVFSPLVGGTTADDIKTGKVARLKDGAYPGRTTLMKVPTVSTLWDYINRAMPWTQPKSLTVEEVYSVTAFLLNLGGVLPDDFTLSDQTMAQAQARMPNRNGMYTEHALWPGKEFSGVNKPDVQGSACTKNCAVEVKVASLLPAHARNAHGNLAEQNRAVGVQHGADTSRPESGDKPSVATVATPQAPARVAAATAAQAKTEADNKGVDAKAAIALLGKYNCTACHGVSQKIVGPGFTDIGKKYPGQASYLQEKIAKGSAGVWGSIPMPAQTLPAADAKAVAQWLASGAPR